MSGVLSPLFTTLRPPLFVFVYFFLVPFSFSKSNLKVHYWWVISVGAVLRSMVCDQEGGGRFVRNRVTESGIGGGVVLFCL